MNKKQTQNTLFILLALIFVLTLPSLKFCKSYRGKYRYVVVFFSFMYAENSATMLEQVLYSKHFEQDCLLNNTYIYSRIYPRFMCMSTLIRSSTAVSTILRFFFKYYHFIYFSFSISFCFLFSFCFKPKQNLFIELYSISLYSTSLSSYWIICVSRHLVF